MRKVLKVLITMLLISSVMSNRVKRRLVFNKGSRFFFRLNVRENLFTYTTIFTYAVGFRVNFDLPDKVLHDKKKIHRRDLYQNIEKFIDQHNGNGKVCVNKFICEAAMMLENSRDFLARLYSIIFTPNENDFAGGYLLEEKNCQEAIRQCPISILHLIPS